MAKSIVLSKYLPQASQVEHPPTSLRNAFALNFTSRVVGIFGRTISVPIAFALLTVEQYGFWLLMSSIANWVSFANLGVPSSLQNQLTHALHDKERIQARCLVAYSFRLMCKIGMGFALCAIVFSFIAPWQKLLDLKNLPQHEFSICVCLVGIFAGLSLPSRLGVAICNAHGNLRCAPLMDLFSQIISLLGIFIAYILVWKSTIALAVINLVSLLCGGSFFTFWALYNYGYSLRESPLAQKERTGLLRKGGVFVLISLGELLVLQSDAFLIGCLKGASSIPLLLVPLSLWANIIHLQNTFLGPSWPLITLAIAKRDSKEVKKLITISMLLTFLYSFTAFAGVIFLGRLFVFFWTSRTIELSPLMVFGIGAYAIVGCVDNFLATILNAFNDLEFRLIYTSICGTVKVVAASVVLTFFTIDPLPLVFSVVMLMCASLPASIRLAILVRRLHS